MRILRNGVTTPENDVIVVDQDKICYLVQNSSHGATGLRTISKALVDEFVLFLESHPDATAFEIKSALSGNSEIDKFEYGYNATLAKLAHLILEHQNDTNYVINLSYQPLATDGPKQIIYYGAPGTGKSHNIDKIADVNNSVRTTFHPDSDYASFVGCYKPVAISGSSENAEENAKLLSKQELTDKIMEIRDESYSPHKISTKYWKSFNALSTNEQKEILKECGFGESFLTEFSKGRSVGEYLARFTKKEKSEITYSFVPQAFTTAYVEAWKDLSKPYYLVIEEINRGNCAQIFGDIFQLLDRGDDGFSSYGIKPDTDLQQYLKNVFSEVNIEDEKIKSGEIMKLPANLHILATMNTSDQSLFPIDSAFKRRWDWKYIPISEADEKHFILVGNKRYSWWSFMSIVNTRIEDVTSSEDKQIGYWFAKPDKGMDISAEKFVSKVIFYLWNDVFKDYMHSSDNIFNIEDKETKAKRLYKFREFYLANGDVDENMLDTFLTSLKVELQPTDSPTPTE